MKKVLSIVICILFIISMFCITVSAEVTDEVLTLPEDDGTGYPITGIADSYSNDEDIVKVIVPENIVRLGDNAFFGCKNLNQIKLHSKIERIGEKAFEGTAYYKDPDNWDNGVLYIGDCLIKADPEKISDIYEIKNGTRLIAAGAFKNCENLNSIIVPNTIEHIGQEAFLGTNFFDNKENWSKGSLILDYLFIAVDDTLSGTFTIPDEISTIADGAFSHSKIKELITSDSLKFIGQDAFWDCQELTKVYLGLNIQSIGRGPFRMCDKLQEIIIHKNNENYSVTDEILYNKSFSSVIRCPQKKVGEISLPISVKKINAYAFESCTEITCVTIPEGCIFIGNSAFSMCENLSDTLLPESLEYIDNNAFAYCNNIESVTIPDNVYFLGKHAFSCCMKLKEVTIGNSIDKLRSGLFESCEKLNKVTLGENIEEIDNTVFLSSGYVSNINNYKNGLLISSKKYLIKVGKDVAECYVPSGVTVIADGAFEYPAKDGYIHEVHIPSSVKQLNWKAFYDIKDTPIYYDGSIYDLNGICDVANLYTEDLYNGIWLITTLFGVFVLLVISIWITNKSTKREKLKETEK